MSRAATVIPRAALKMLVLAAAAACAGQAGAAELQFAPAIEVGFVSDSNLRLAEVAEEVDVAGAFASGRFEFVALTPLARLSFTPRVAATYFPADEDRDEDFVNGGANLLWLRDGRTISSRFQLDYDNSVTVTGNRAGTPPEDGELGNPVEDGDSGVLDQNRVKTFSAREQLRFRLSERNAVEAGLSFTDRTFEEQSIEEDVSYTAWGANLAWRHQFRERSSFALRGRAVRYNPELVPVITQTLGLEGEWTWQASERVDTYLRLGANRASYDSSAGPDPDDRNAVVGGVGGSWRLRVSRVLLDATRSIEPNSAGYSVERSQLRLRLDRDFSPRVRGSIAGRLLLDEGPAGFNERRYGVASIGMEWRLTRALAIGGRYDHTWQDYDLTPGSAASNAFRLSLTYEPRRPVEDRASIME